MRFALILETYNELRSRLLDFLQPKNKEEEKKGASVEAEKLGSGRVIPIKQVQIHQLSAITSKPYIMKRFHLEEVCFITGTGQNEHWILTTMTVCFRTNHYLVYIKIKIIRQPVLERVFHQN